MGYFLHRTVPEESFNFDRAIAIMDDHGARRIGREIPDPVGEPRISPVTIMELGEASFDVGERGTTIKMEISDDVSDDVAQMVYRLMIDQGLVFHQEYVTNVLAPSEDLVPTDPMFAGSKVVHSWQELKQIANFEDPEEFF